MSDLPGYEGIAVTPFRESTDERDRWDKGRIRHLRVSTDCPPDSVYAIRVRHEGPREAEDILYTLVVHPKHVERVDEYRRMAEPRVGGVFSPDADVD